MQNPTNPKFIELLYIFKDNPKQRIFDINHFEDEIQDDQQLVDTWNDVFDMLPIEVADTIIEDSDIDERISNAVDAQTEYYHTTGLCFQTTNNKNVYDGVVLPVNYNDMVDFLTNIDQTQLNAIQY